MIFLKMIREKKRGYGSRYDDLIFSDILNKSSGKVRWSPGKNGSYYTFSIPDKYRKGYDLALALNFNDAVNQTADFFKKIK